MYEDNRKIRADGMLSAASRPKYIPKPIRFDLPNPNAAKPAATHVNVNKELERQRAYQEEQLKLQREGLKMQREQMEDGGGGGKVICTRYHELGFLSDEIFKADDAYGDRICLENPELMLWYWSWAIPYVKHCMHGETLFSQLMIVMFWPVCRAWATEMAYREGVVKKGSLLGRLMMKTVIGFFNFSKTHHHRAA